MISSRHLDPEVTGGGFDSLLLRIERHGVSLVHQLFEDVSAALAFFDDHVLAFGGDAMPGSLHIAFDLRASKGDGFAASFLFQGQPAMVPEPSPGLLLLLGVVLLARPRRSR